MANLQTSTHWSRGQISNFEFWCNPQEIKFVTVFYSGTCLGTLETNVLLSFLWSIFLKWPVTKVTLLTLKIAVQKHKTNNIYYAQ